MRRGFVYNAGQQRTRQQRQRGGASQSAYPSLQMSHASPRKRKRSPENPASGQRGPKAVKPKSSFEDDSDGDLDELGTAALEEFELTQREGNKSPSPIPEPVSQFHAPIGRPNQASYPTAATSNPVSNRSQRWPNPYDKKETPQVAGFQNQPSLLGGQSQNGRTMKVSPPPDSENRYKEEIHQLQARNQQLLEQNYTKDGEVKVLRNEKERMVGELRKKEGLMHELHTRLLSEQQAKEQQMTKENQSLMTQLKFKEQELLNIQAKLAIIEQKQKQSIAQPSPVPPSRAPLKMTSGSKSKLQTLGKEQKMEFLSTETFMPLSQVSSGNVTAVHVQQRIGPQSEQDGTAKQKMSVPSIETSPITALAPKNHQESEDITTPAGTSVPEPHDAPSARQESPSKSIAPDPDQKDPPVVLDIPSIGSDLVMLLVQHDLLKVPKFKAEEGMVSSDQHAESLDVSPPMQPLHKLTGLLSLLHIPVQDSASSLTFSHALTTPVSRLRSEDAHSFTGGSLKPMPSLDSSTEMIPKTPIRRPRIQPLKSLTCARSDLSRARTRQMPPGKSLSAANTPIRDNPEQQMVSSLASSINKSGLEQSIASLLRSTDSSKVSTMFKSLSRICTVSPSPTVSRKPIRSDASCVYMLQHIGDVIVKYYNEQLVKVKAVSLSSEHVPDLGENYENSIQSPKSSLSSSTTSSRISQDFSPAPADQELVSQLLSALETLTTYSRCVREQLLAEPPEFHIDSGPPSVVEAQSTSTDDDEACMEVEVPHASKEQGHIARSYSIQAITRYQQATPTLQRGSMLKERKEWEGVQLVQLKSNSGCKVWIPEAAAELRSIPRSSYQHTPLHQAFRGTEKIFTTLLELTSPGPWRESVENTVSCLNILSSLAEDCPVGSLERFSPLLLDDSIDVCLEEREDGLITMATLRLLTHMVKSPAIVTLLCRQGDNCTLLTCYQCFLDPPSSSSDTTHKIHIQLLRLISNILLVSEGPKVLFESSVCSCSHELLKSLVTLLNRLIRDVHEPKQLSHQNLSLVCELVSTLHKISVQDRDYDTHREKCLHPLTFVLNTLSWLLKAIPTTQAEVVLIKDLLENCEEPDDSQENSERMDER